MSVYTNIIPIPITWLMCFQLPVKHIGGGVKDLQDWRAAFNSVVCSFSILSATSCEGGSYIDNFYPYCLPCCIDNVHVICLSC